MYFVDQEKIEATLEYLTEKINVFKSHGSWESPLEKAALERVTQMMLEAVLDVGNAMIDGFIMRDPGSYEDIIDILADEKVITDEMGDSLKILVGYRKVLVQFYTEVSHGELIKQFQLHLGVLEQFSVNVREYLKNELGPVSAFKN